jgi:hypothetical protein
VVGPDGAPIAKAAVQAIGPEDTPSEGTRIFGDLVSTGSDGRFHLVVAGTGDALVIAVMPGLRPAWVPTLLARGATRQLGTFRLERGAALAGRVRCGGVSRDRIRVIATWYGTRKDGTRPAGDQRLWVEDGRVVWSQLETQPDDDGRFHIGGLEEGPYRLRVPAEDWGCALHPDAYAQVDFLTRAPNARIDVDADRSQMVIEVADGADLVHNAVVTLDGRDRIRLNAGSNGEVGVVLHSGRRHRATVEADGFMSASLDVTSAGPGERRRERVPLTRVPAGMESKKPPWTPQARDDDVELLAVGPDGVPIAAPCRVTDARGAVIPAEFVELRPVVQIVSADRLGVGGGAVVLPHLPADAGVTIGGGDFEEVRWPSDGGKRQLDAFDGGRGNPTVVRAILRAR